MKQCLSIRTAKTFCKSTVGLAKGRYSPYPPQRTPHNKTRGDLRNIRLRRVLSCFYQQADGSSRNGITTIQACSKPCNFALLEVNRTSRISGTSMRIQGAAGRAFKQRPGGMLHCWRRQLWRHSPRHTGAPSCRSTRCLQWWGCPAATTPLTLSTHPLHGSPGFKALGMSMATLHRDPICRDILRGSLSLHWGARMQRLCRAKPFIGMRALPQEARKSRPCRACPHRSAHVPALCTCVGVRDRHGMEGKPITPHKRLTP